MAMLSFQDKGSGEKKAAVRKIIKIKTPSASPGISIGRTEFLKRVHFVIV